MGGRPYHNLSSGGVLAPGPSWCIERVNGAMGDAAGTWSRLALSAVADNSLNFVSRDHSSNSRISVGSSQ